MSNDRYPYKAELPFGVARPDLLDSLRNQLDQRLLNGEFICTPDPMRYVQVYGFEKEEDRTILLELFPQAKALP